MCPNIRLHNMASIHRCIFFIWTRGEDKLQKFSLSLLPSWTYLLRVSRVCSHEADFRKHTTEMKSWFLERGYRNDLIQKEM